MLRVIVESAKVNEKSGNSVKTGRPYRIREQEVYVYLVDDGGVEKKFPTAMRIGLEEAPPYEPGEYLLSPACLYVGKFDQLVVGRITLKPRAAQGMKSAA